MDNSDTRYIGGWGCPPVSTSFQTPRLDGLPTNEDQHKTCTSFPLLKRENFLSNDNPAKTFEPREVEYIDQSGDTELNTECKLHFYTINLVTDLLLVESSSISNPQLPDYTSSRTLSEEIPVCHKRVKPSRIKGKKFKGKLIVKNSSSFFIDSLLSARSHIHHDGYRWRLGPRNLTEKSALNLKRNEIQDMISSESVQKNCTNTILKKRPDTEQLLSKLEKVIKEYFKDITLEGNVKSMASADILSWKEICHKDIGNDKEQKIREFCINFKYISYT